jgi:hypothetical protein
VDAARLSERWYEECQERGLPTDSYHPLKAGLRDFLPVEARAGIAYRDERPIVLGLTDEALLFFTPPPTSQHLDALALPTRSVRALAVSSGHAGNARTDYRVCTWTLRHSAGDPLIHETRAVLGNGSFDSDNGGEGVMLALAGHLGWPTPLHLQNAPHRHG